MDTLISLAFKHDFSTSMGIWVLFSVLVWWAYAWFTPSEQRGTQGNLLTAPVGRSLGVITIWSLMTYGLHSAGILN